MVNCCTTCCYGTIYFCQQIHENYIRNNRPVQIILGVIGGALLMVILLAIFGAFRSTACANCSDENNLYYSLFTKTWAQTTCKEYASHVPARTCIATLPTSITVHGLWPQLRTKKAYLRHCLDNADSPFLEDKIKDLVGRLNPAWPSVDSAITNVDFWKHQWEQHGACTPLTVKDYFDRSLQLDTNYPISKWLTEAKITPTNNATYTLKAFKEALDKKVGADQYELICAKIKLTNVNVTVEQEWLQDVSVCVQYSNSIQATKCVGDKLPNAASRCTTDKIYFVEDYKTMVPPST